MELCSFCSLTKSQRLLGCWCGVAVKEASGNGTFTVDDDIIIIWGWGSWLGEAARLLGTRIEEYRRLYVLIMGWCGKERNADRAMSYYSAATNKSSVPQAKPWWVFGGWDLHVRYVSSHRCCLTMDRGRKWVHCYILIKQVEIQDWYFSAAVFTKRLGILLHYNAWYFSARKALSLRSKCE